MESIKDAKFKVFENEKVSALSQITGGALRKNVKTKNLGATEWTDTAHEEYTGEESWVGQFYGRDKKKLVLD